MTNVPCRTFVSYDCTTNLSAVFNTKAQYASRPKFKTGIDGFFFASVST